MFLRNICNYCESLKKEYYGAYSTSVRAVCEACKNTLGAAKYIDTVFSDVETIDTPVWCPKRQSDDSAAYGQTSPKKEYTYTEKRSIIMDFPRNVAWEDIKEGSLYVIPKILYTPMKVVKVESIDKTKAICRELSFDDGFRERYTTYIYPNDIDAIMLVPFHKY